MAESEAPPLALLLDGNSSSFKRTRPSTYEYSSGFSQESFLSNDFNVTQFINTCTARINEMINDDFNKTLDLIDSIDVKHEYDEDNKDNKDNKEDDVSTTHHLTASNLKQLHNDLSECYENLKQELINSFQQNYPQFIQLNQSLTIGTETNLKKLKESLNNIHKKYFNIYQQILRLLEKIHSKSILKSNYISKLNTLKQIEFVPNYIENIKISLKTLHHDFDPFININTNDRNDRNHNNKHFKDEFRREISNATERKQYRLLQKSLRLERMAILLTKLTAIFKQNQLNQHILIKNKEKEFIGLKNRFYNELSEIFLLSIHYGSLLSLRSNLRCYNYLNDEKPELIVRENFIGPSICVCLPISLFINRSNLTTQKTSKQRKEGINAAFNKLYNVLMDKWSILFNAEIMINNDFIADGVWIELIETLLNEDYGELFISRGLPDLFHTNYSSLIRFFRKLQKLYYKQMTCNIHKMNDKYLYYHIASIKLRKKCNLEQYYLFRMPNITKNLKNIISMKYENINYHFKVYISYYNKMKNIENNNDNDDNDDDDDENKENINDYMKRLNEVKEALIMNVDKNKNENNKTNPLQYKHFEYNYLLPIFQVSIINLLKCWDSEKIWIWELSPNFLKLSVEILSFLYNYLNKQINELCSSSLLILIHSDLYYFCNWIQYELEPLIEYQFIDCIANIDNKNNIKELISKSINISMDNLINLRNNLLNKIIINEILNECQLSLHEVDELADSWQANISFDNQQNQDPLTMQHKVSQYVSKLFKPLKEFLMFINNHSLEHITIKQKNELIWNILNGICNEYWNKIKKVQERLAQIRKIMERRRRFKNKSDTNKNETKSGAERAEYQLFLDCRQFMQQIQGFINGLQRDQKIYYQKIEKEKQEKTKKSSSIIVAIKKKKSIQEKTIYTTDNLQCWHNFDKFVQQFQ